MIEPGDTALFILNSDAKCDATDARLRALLVDLERQGVAPKVIAASLARVLLGFCAEHARTIENYGWVASKLMALTDLLQLHQSKANHRSWVARFLKRQHRLYNEARFQMQPDMVPPPLPPFAIAFSEPAGRA